MKIMNIPKAIALKSHLLTLKQQETQLTAMRQKNYLGAETIEVFKTIKSVTIKKYANELTNDLGELKDGEDVGKVEKCLEKLASLMNQGVEIYTSIDTPKEVKMLFPMNENNNILSEDLIKLLEDKK